MGMSAGGGQMASTSRLTQFILGALVLGIISGAVVHQLGAGTAFPVTYAENVSLLTDVFCA